MERNKLLSRAAVFLAVTAGACTPSATPTPEVCAGTGNKITLQTGEKMNFNFGTTTLIEEVLGTGPGDTPNGEPDAVSLSGSGILTEGDELVRELDGKKIKLGCVEQINPQDDNVEIIIYDQAQEITEV